MQSDGGAVLVMLVHNVKYIATFRNCVPDSCYHHFNIYSIFTTIFFIEMHRSQEH